MNFVYYLGILNLLVFCVGGQRQAFAQKIEQFVVVIDPGHGGRDTGAIAYGYKEKDIVLSVALKLGKLIKAKYPKVKVLYTREQDVFIGLQARADFANTHNASLLISIHANSAPNKQAYGTETYVLGQSKQANNLSVAMRENKVMLLEENYQMTYKGFDPTNIESYIMFDLMQEAYLTRSIDMANYIEQEYQSIGRKSRGVRQEGLWVLSQSAMPSILTEIGFISNKTEAHYIGSDKGQANIAQALARAFNSFYERKLIQKEKTSFLPLNEKSQKADTLRYKQDATKSTLTEAREKDIKKRKEVKTYYRVQFMATISKVDPKDKQFRRLGVQVYRDKSNKYWVYTIGNSQSLEEIKLLQKKILQFYPDCFIVSYIDEIYQGRLK